MRNFRAFPVFACVAITAVVALFILSDSQGTFSFEGGLDGFKLQIEKTGSRRPLTPDGM